VQVAVRHQVDVVVQFEQALANLRAALAGAGGGPEHLAKLTIFAVDPQDYRARSREIGAVWQRLAGRDYPAMALIGIVRLWDAPALVELEGIAVLPD
jgi:enamine deaminase RidA (YjgF/YER057c/UK114 family)